MSGAPAYPDSVFLVDASIYIFQSHFSPYVECFDQEGNELSALFGFTQFLLQFLKRVQPSHIAIAQDQSLFCGFRHELCPDYKSNRELPDENLEMQLQGCMEVCDYLALPCFGSKMYEADDIIGTLSTRVRSLSKGHSKVQIVSKDKDLAQLLRHDEDCLWDYSANRKRRRSHIQEEFGVSPEQFPDYLGLTGDSVDCISGVPGVGPVKAKELISHFGNLDNLYANLHQVADLPLRGAARLGALLQEHRERAELSRRLAVIVCDVDVREEPFSQVGLDQLQRDRVDHDGLTAFLQRHKFRDEDRRRILALAGGL